MPTRRHALPVIAFLLVAIPAACAGPTATPSPTGSTAPGGTTPSPAPSTDTGAIDHPTGADQVVLRLEEGGGLMMVEWVATEAPIFTLYGDGTVIYRNPSDPAPESRDGLIRGTPFKTTRLSEAMVQELLAFAINDGALGIARARYDNNMFADASTTTFTIEAEGQRKTVAVYALMEADEGQDAVVRRAFHTLATRLKEFGGEGVVFTEWLPDAYRGTLIESQGAPGVIRDWPWPNIAVDDFKKADGPNAPGFPRRVMTPAELAALALADHEGGLHGLYLEAPDGKVYALAIRPLFPDEAT